MRRLRSALGRAARTAYLSLPLKWGTRLRLKSWLFHRLQWLLAETNVYKRWQYFEGVERSMSSGRGHVSSTAIRSDGCNDVWHQNLVRQARSSFGNARQRHGAEYVEIAKAPLQSGLRARAIAFYLPQFHPIAENDEWWGRGFTEWTNVSKAQPQFVDHYQPHLPGELGFYDLRLREVMHRQIELARLYGIEAFCFHYYWFSGRRLLDRPLNQYMADPSLDLPFCLCWANESWTRRWDGMEADILLGQVYNDDNDEAFIQDLIPYLRDKRYVRVDGKPLIIVYRPSLLPNCRRTLGHWRETCKKMGIGEVFIAMVQFDRFDPSEYGFDAALEFPPHKLAAGLECVNGDLDLLNPEYEGHVVRYQDIVRVAENMPVPAYPLMRGVFPSWDNEARKPGRGYTFVGSTPMLYRRWLDNAVEYAIQHPVAAKESIVFINAWNEWAEGAHLEPDRKYGYAYLQATRDVLEQRTQEKVFLLCHDAHPHGAQYLALNLAKELVHLGVDVHVGLLGPGILQAEFEKVCSTELFEGAPSLHRTRMADLKAQGFSTVLANTVVSGRLVPLLKEVGFRVVSLVHELSGVIQAHGLQEVVTEIGRQADVVVVSSKPVEAAARELMNADDCHKLVLRAQGLFTRNRYRRAAMEDVDALRARLRERLGLPHDARIVLTVGYADKRKGVDILIDVAEAMSERDARVHFVWVGHWDVSIRPEIEEHLQRKMLEGNVHFVGMDFETDEYYAGADAYALLSREDPFPSVVLESLSVGTPVVAFHGTGGGAELLDRGVGLTVPPFDAVAFADALLRVISDESLRSEMACEAMELIEREFSFRTYAIDLLNLTRPALPKVSVVIPNFNYARYLPERIESVCSQTYPIYELIVLDDRSTDESVRVINAMRSSVSPELQLVINRDNSGSVFKQWLKGAELARGEYVWIAEADDLSDRGFLAAVLQRMNEHPGAVMGYSQSRQIDASGIELAPDYLAYTDELSTTRWRSTYYAEGADEVAEGLAIKNTIPNVSAAVFRRDALIRVLRENMDEILSYRIAGDWLAYLHLMKLGGVTFEPTALNAHRRHAQSVTVDTELQKHHDEVTAVQAAARSMFILDEAVDARASGYANRLQKQFGLVDIT